MQGFEDWSGRRFRNIDLTGAVFKETMLVNARFSGLIDGLVVNDIEVAPLIAAEMERRYPERAQLRPTDAAGARAAWDVIEQLWAATKARVASLDEDVVQTRPEEDEWSCAETFRHLVFVTDGWITRTALGRDDLHHPWSVPPSFITGLAHIDTDARPNWQDIVPVRESRLATVRAFVDGLEDADLAARRGDVTVQQCLHVVLDEEWHHNWFANRDLDQLVSPDR
jgi:uncharacterized damage-inducible protein DinB